MRNTFVTAVTIISVCILQETDALMHQQKPITHYNMYIRDKPTWLRVTSPPLLHTFFISSVWILPETDALMHKQKPITSLTMYTRDSNISLPG